MSIRVYVAAASGDAERVARAIDGLRSSGFIVTCTWPEVIAKTPGGANPTDATVSARAGWSTQDLREVAAADVLWLLVPRAAHTKGAWFEAGVAHALGKHLVFSGPTVQSVFCALGEEFDSDESALAHLKLYAADRPEVRPVDMRLKDALVSTDWDLSDIGGQK